MHFVFTAPRYHTNQRFAAKALHDAGHRVSFVALRREHSEVYDELEPIVLGEERVAPWLNGSEWVWPPPRAFWSLMRRLRPDVAVVRSPYTAYGWLAMTAARSVGARVLLYVQTPMHGPRSRKKSLFSNLVARGVAGGWITPVLGHPDRYPPQFRPQRYVPFVMEPQTPPESKRWFRSACVNVLCVGKFQARKNHDMLLEVLARLSGKYAVHATIVGDCATEERQRVFARVREVSSVLDMDDRVQFKCNLPYHDVQSEYAAHDLFVLPSSRETAAVSHLEAMSHSLPVICSDSNGTRCYIRDGENGYVFRSGDKLDLAARMESIIADRDKLVNMGERSHSLVLSEHSPEKYVRTMTELARKEE